MAEVKRNKPYCPVCNEVGMGHCAHPEECGEVIYPQAHVEKLEKRIAALDAVRRELIDELEQSREIMVLVEEHRIGKQFFLPQCKAAIKFADGALARARALDQ